MQRQLFWKHKEASSWIDDELIIDQTIKPSNRRRPDMGRVKKCNIETYIKILSLFLLPYIFLKYSFRLRCYNYCAKLPITTVIPIKELKNTLNSSTLVLLP